MHIFEHDLEAITHCLDRLDFKRQPRHFPKIELTLLQLCHGHVVFVLKRLIEGCLVAESLAPEFLPLLHLIRPDDLHFAHLVRRLQLRWFALGIETLSEDLLRGWRFLMLNVIHLTDKRCDRRVTLS